jgi:hypothetical protein
VALPCDIFAFARTKLADREFDAAVDPVAPAPLPERPVAAPVSCCTQPVTVTV